MLLPLSYSALTIAAFISGWLVPHSFADGKKHNCKCLPSDPCWPSKEEWQHFNASVGGILIDVRPIAAVCYEGTPEFDQAKCKNVETEFRNSSWRADQPGAVQYQTWETNPATNESCYVPSLVLPPNNPPTECKQGSIPLYGVPARSAEDIATAVKFVKMHNIPVVIKNSGHDLLGRATRKDSLMIWTHFMNKIEFLNTNSSTGWTPAGCNGRETMSYREKEPLVKVAAGVNLYDLYQAVGARNRTVVGGSASSVGVAGGYVQGGGHSALGPWKGMASDHVVEAEIVTADGNIVRASPCENSDLFWAIRGGGGGTFGVVTSATLRTFDNPPMVMYNFNITISIPPDNRESADNKIWNFTTQWHRLAPALNDLGGSGYYYILTNVPPGVHLFYGIIVFAGSDYHNGTDVANFFAPLKKWAYENIQSPNSSFVTTSLDVFPQTSIYFNLIPKSDPSMGGTSILGSRLLSREILSTPEGVDKVTAAFKDISVIGGQYNVIIGHYVAGGAVAANEQKVDSALNPAWRKALAHIALTHGWETGDPFDKQSQIKRLMTEEMVPKLKQLDWDEKLKKQTMGAYVNEADKEEKDWQDSFWGSNYEKLLKLKQKWDPKGVFWCRPCVGSENWDREGVCRV